jgi:FMN-dependent NADH-azoreductase
MDQPQCQFMDLGVGHEVPDHVPMKILHVSCSPRGQASESYRLARRVIDSLLEKNPGAVLVTRDLAVDAIPQVDANYALSQQSDADVSKEGSAALSAELIQELASADIVVIGTPVHNFTVPSALKAWIDHVVRVRLTFDISRGGKIPLLRNRPVFVAVAAGGRYSGDRARQPDFLSPYLRAALDIIGLHDMTFFSVEGTAFGPEALAESRSKADQAIQRYFRG